MKENTLTTQMTITDFLKNFPFVQEFKSGYSPYRCAGFFGFFLKGSPDKTLDMVMLVQAWLEQFILNLSNLVVRLIWGYEEILKARSSLFSDLTMLESAEDLGQDAGNYLLYYNRIVGKKEVAKKCSIVSDINVFWRIR